MVDLTIDPLLCGEYEIEVTAYVSHSYCRTCPTHLASLACLKEIIFSDFEKSRLTGVLQLPALIDPGTRRMAMHLIWCSTVADFSIA